MNENSPESQAGGSDRNIRFIRALAVVMIFTCHILEGYGSFLAWWLNAGVQVFLFTSGFLFGRRAVVNWREWFTRRLGRILPAYYLLILLVALLEAGLFKQRGIGRELLASLCCVQDFLNLRLPGCDHLWFITLILVCYLTVPLLQSLRDGVKSPVGGALIFFVGLPLAFYLAYKAFPFMSYPYVANLTTFAWGYYCASQLERLESTEGLRQLLWALPTLAVLLLAGRGVLEYYQLTELGALHFVYFKLLLPWGKLVLAAALFLGLYLHPWKTGAGRIVGFIDRYAYEIYLTHHLFIFGSFSMLRLVRPRAIDILLIAALTMISAVGLSRTCEVLASLLDWFRSRPAKAQANT